MRLRREATSDSELRLRVWSPGDDDTAASTGGPFLTSESTLRDLFDGFVVPMVLKLDKDEAADHPNAKIYYDAIGWFEKLIGEPPLRLIDDVMLVQFEKALHKATYKRGRLGQDRPLAEFTIAKHLKNVRAILFRAGPKHADKKRPSKGLLEEVPHIVVATPRLDLPSRKFTLKQARSIFAACDEMVAYHGTIRLAGDGGPGAPDWWRAFIAAMYFTGLRLRSYLSLRWSMLVNDDDGTWLRVPKRNVHKTGKATIKFVRPDLLALLERLRTPTTKPEDFIFPWNHSLTHLRDRHEQLQHFAGLAETLCLHTWKGVHTREKSRTGFDEVKRRAQEAADHSDDKTTTEHYYNPERDAFLLMAPLVEPPKPAKPRDEKAPAPNQMDLF